VKGDIEFKFKRYDVKFYKILNINIIYVVDEKDDNF
jgi:hypothetical protein